MKKKKTRRWKLNEIRQSVGIFHVLSPIHAWRSISLSLLNRPQNYAIDLFGIQIADLHRKPENNS